MNRLFIALPLPAAVRQTLCELDPGMPGMRWTPPGNLHLTLCFLGDVDGAGQQRLEAELSQVKCAPFDLSLEGMGLFGGNKPTVLWAGIGKGLAELHDLQAQVVAAVRRVSWPLEERAYYPHVTLARVRAVPAAALESLLSPNRRNFFGSWTVEEFILYTSTLGSEGASHSAVLHVSLGV